MAISSSSHSHSHLHSQNNWIFTPQDVKHHTPSRRDGISYEKEIYERAFGVDLIVRVGAVRVDVPLLTIATASIFLHRFYMLQSLAKYPAREVAIACLFLAGKVEESLRKVETVVNYCLRLEDRRKGKEPDVHPSSEHFKKLVQQVLYIEEVILVNLQFDLTVQHPHPLLTRAARSYEPGGGGNTTSGSSKGPTTRRIHSKERLAIARASWQIMSDIYTTPLCITYNIGTLASAAFLLSWQLLSPEIVPPLDPSDLEWKKYFSSNNSSTSGDGKKGPSLVGSATGTGVDWEDENAVKEVHEVMECISAMWTKAKNERYKTGGSALKENIPSAASFLSAPQAIKAEKSQAEAGGKAEAGGDAEMIPETAASEQQQKGGGGGDGDSNMRASASAMKSILNDTVESPAQPGIHAAAAAPPESAIQMSSAAVEEQAQQHAQGQEPGGTAEEGEMEVETEVEKLESPVKEHEQPPTPG